MSEVMWIFGFMVFLGFLTFISSLPDTPPELKIIEPFDFLWFGGGLLSVSGACVIATGLPCAAALAVFGVGTILQYLVIKVEYLKVLIFMPMIITLVYLMSRLGRGGG